MQAVKQRYKKDFVDLKEYERIKLESKSSREIEVLSSWYCIDARGYLVPTEHENHFFNKIENYITTVAKPMIDIDTKDLFFQKNDFDEIERDVLGVLKAGTFELNIIYFEKKM